MLCNTCGHTIREIQTGDSLPCSRVPAENIDTNGHVEDCRGYYHQRKPWEIQQVCQSCKDWGLLARHNGDFTEELFILHGWCASTKSVKGCNESCGAWEPLCYAATRIRQPIHYIDCLPAKEVLVRS